MRSQKSMGYKKRERERERERVGKGERSGGDCLLYTSDAADDS